MNRAFRSLMLFIAVAISGLAAHAQLSTATMYGTVTDSTGAAVPGATVVITQTDTQTTRTIKTNGDGSYRADFLPVGPYKLSVSSQGFKTLERTGITLTVTEEAHVDLQLEPGGEATTVEVTAEVPLLNTGNSTLGRTVSNVEIDNLPLVDRNVYTLLDLTPGVQNNNNSGSGGNGGVINPLGYPEQHVKINGSSDSGVGQVSYYLDGGSNMTGVRNTGNPLPNPDAIREFRVDTNNFSAQYGRNSAGVVTVLTKSGTNDFHGSVFEFYRDRNFNATTRAAKDKTAYNQHRFGFTVGGPVKKDKLFFFGSYAGFRFSSANIFTPNVPSAAMLQGNFSENLPLVDGTHPEPADNLKCTVAAQSSTKFWACNPFLPKATAWCPGNICSPSGFDPAIAAIVKAGLIPTSPGNGNYTIQQVNPFRQKTDEQLYRGDYQITPKQRLMLSYFHETGDFINNPSGNNIQNWVSQNYNFAQHESNVAHTWTISNATVNQLMLNYTRLIGGRVPTPAQTLTDFGSKFQEQMPDGSICGVPAQAGCARPDLNVSGWFRAANAITGPVTGSNVYAIRDIVSSTHGKHTLYYGAEGNRENDAQQTTLNNYGVFSFTAHTNTANKSSAAITDFLYGTPNSMAQDVPVYANANYFNYGLFVQDDWRMLSSLTVNLGLRYDIQTTPTDTQRMTMQFVPGAQSSVAPTLPKGVLLPGDKGVPAGGVNTRYDHVSPRVGFAWTPYPDGRTVIHAAAGMFYGSVGGNLFTYPSNGEPFSGRPTFSGVIHVSDPYATDPADFCGGNPTCIAGGVGHSPFPFIYDPKHPSFFVVPAAIIPVDPNFHWPVSYQFNAGFEQQLGGGFAFSASYVGAFSRKLPTEWDLNYPQFNLTSSGTSGPSCTDVTLPCAYPNSTANGTTGAFKGVNQLNARRPYNARTYAATATTAANNPFYSTISQIQSSESANYNSLQVTIQRRLSKGFSAQGYYVWSKTLQSLNLDANGNTGNSTTTEPEDNNNHWLDRQRSDYDQRHVVAASIVWKPNFNFEHRAFRLMVNDWTITSIIRLQSGMPFNVTTGTDDNADGVNNDRPNLVPGVRRATLTDNGTSRTAMINNWVSPTQFCTWDRTYTWGTTTVSPCAGAGPAGSDGTVRQNELDAPGRRDIDMSIFRDFPVWERVTFQLRGEATNVFNLTNLGAPISTLSSSNFGHITAAYSGGSFGNRIIQVGGRILF